MNLIVAVTNDYAIGKDNDLLFHLPTDLKFFKEKTMGKVVVFGERTYYSLPKRPLPGRTNIVLTDNPNFSEQGVTVVHSLSDLLSEVKKYAADDVFICGGASVYNLMLPYCARAYVTKIDKIVPADTYITNIEQTRGWQIAKKSQPIEENGVKFAFLELFNTTTKNH